MKKLSKQQGFALFLLAVLLATAATTVSIKALNHSSCNTQIARDRITAAALAQARDALIGYAITYGDTHSGNVHGFLPCPDTSGTDIGGEGAAAGSCGPKNTSSIGRLPWRTLDLPPLRGGDNECLWYAVSGTYKYNPPSGLVNWDTNGQLQVYASDGTTLLTPADNQAVAVIFAPGVALGQNHPVASGTSSCGGNYTASNYLDNDTVHGINDADIATGKFIQSHEDRDANGKIILTVNDRIVFITKQDIWNAMQKRESVLLGKLDDMTRQTAECIANFGRNNQISGTPNILNKSLPWPAPLSLTDYTDNTQYDDQDGLFSGRVPYKVNTSQDPTHNSISDPYYLLQANGANCPVPADWAAIYPWWNNWKDHLFYAISQRFKPDSSATIPCDSNHCLSVNNNPSNNAAVVIFAGKKLANQTRADKSVVTDYLEGRNATYIADPHTSGIENYQLDATNGTFNDIVYCIKDDLTVVKGNPLTTPACPP